MEARARGPIVRSGKLPLLVLLVERKGRSVATLITAVEMIPSLEDQVAAIEAAENDRLFTRPLE
jgi:hypothetical protein